MGGRTGVLEAAALIDRDVDKDTSGFIRDTSSLVTSFGALAPGMSTAPITRSASRQAFSSSKVLETTVWIFVPKILSAS